MSRACQQTHGATLAPAFNSLSTLVLGPLSSGVLVADCWGTANISRIHLTSLPRTHSRGMGRVLVPTWSRKLPRLYCEVGRRGWEYAGYHSAHVATDRILFYRLCAPNLRRNTPFSSRAGLAHVACRNPPVRRLDTALPAGVVCWALLCGKRRPLSATPGHVLRRSGGDSCCLGGDPALPGWSLALTRQLCSLAGSG